MSLFIALAGLLSGCGPLIIAHPLPTTPITAAQPTAAGHHRVSVVHSRFTDFTTPNMITGATIGRLDLGRERGDLGLSLGTLYSGKISPTAGVTVGRSLLTGDAGSFGMTGGLGGSFVDASYTETIGNEDGTTTRTEQALYYSSLASSLGVRGVFYPTPWLGLAGTLGSSYSAVWVWGEGSGPREVWAEGSGGVLLGDPDRMQFGLAWQSMVAFDEGAMPFHALHAALSLSR